MNDDWKFTFVTPIDPAGSQFDPWAQPGPEGQWGYALDDHGIRYRRVGWPFGRTPARGRGEPEPASVRLAPDTDYRSWRNEYVLLYPGRIGQWGDAAAVGWAHAYLDLWVRRQGMGGMIVPRVEVEIDIDSAALHVAATCPAVLREQSEMKADRLLAFLRHHTSRARTPRARRTPATAHDAYLKRGHAAHAGS